MPAEKVARFFLERDSHLRTVYAPSCIHLLSDGDRREGHAAAARLHYLPIETLFISSATEDCLCRVSSCWRKVILFQTAKRLSMGRVEHNSRGNVSPKNVLVHNERLSDKSPRT